MRGVTVLLGLLAIKACVPAALELSSPSEALTTVAPSRERGAAHLLTSDEIAALEAELEGYLLLRGDPRVKAFTVSVLADINAARVEAGLGALILDPGLELVAELRAADMVANGYFAHKHPRRGTLEAERLLRSAAYRGAVAELLLSSTGTLDDVELNLLDNLLAEPGHREQVMQSRFSSAGVGLMGDETWWYIVLLLAESQPED